MPFLGKTPSQIVDPEVDIDGGTIDGVSIGSVTANAGAFTNLTATGTLTLPDDGISGDDVNGGTISNFASTGIDDNATSTAITIDASQNIQVGPTAVTGGRYFDIYNTGSTATDFAITRFITQQVGSSSTTSADIFKRKNGQFGISNNDTHADAHINFTVGTTERMRIDSSGAVGIGVTPEAWATYTPIQVQQSSLASFNNGDARLTNNAYYNSGWKYIDSRYATQYLMDASNGIHTWSTATSGTADGAVTWSEAMRIDNSGDVFIKNGGELKIERPNASNFSSFYTDTGDSTIINNSWSNQKIVLTRDGNVGIGTTAPVGKLELNNGSSAVELQFKETSTAYHRMGVKKIGSQLQLGEYSNDGSTLTTILCVEGNGDKVGIGTSSPSAKLRVNNPVNTTSIRLGDDAAPTRDLIISSFASAGYNGAGWDFNANGQSAAGALTFSTNATERVRIDYSGNFLHGKSNAAANNTGLWFETNSGRTWFTISNSNNTLHVFDETNQVYRFYVGGNGQVNYYSLNNLSDERDKQNIADIPHGLSTVMGLKPRKFDWREEDQANGVYGFIAQEVETVLPSLVGEYKKDDNTFRKSLKQMELIPVLTKAIQEQQAIIEDLQTRLSALEAN